MLLDTHIISGVLAALMLVGFYVFPSVLAYLRHHHNFAAICATNLLSAGRGSAGSLRWSGR